MVQLRLTQRSFADTRRRRSGLERGNTLASKSSRSCRYTRISSNIRQKYACWDGISSSSTVIFFPSSLCRNHPDSESAAKDYTKWSRATLSSTIQCGASNCFTFFSLLSCTTTAEIIFRPGNTKQIFNNRASAEQCVKIQVRRYFFSLPSSSFHSHLHGAWLYIIIFIFEKNEECPEPRKKK